MISPFNLKKYSAFLFIGLGLILIITAVFLIRDNQKVSTSIINNQTNSDEQPIVDRVSLSDAKSAFDGINAVFLDVRTITSFQNSHIPGALSIPLSELSQRKDELDPQKWIITYCT